MAETDKLYPPSEGPLHDNVGNPLALPENPEIFYDPRNEGPRPAYV